MKHYENLTVGVLWTTTGLDAAVVHGAYDLANAERYGRSYTLDERADLMREKLAALCGEMSRDRFEEIVKSSVALSSAMTAMLRVTDPA